MKLYQALTQVTVNGIMVDDDPGFHIVTNFQKPLNFDPDTLYHYIDSVLKSGSRHDENNLKYVSDAAFISENFNYNQHAFSQNVKTFDDKITFARSVVADLNRHLSVNLDFSKKEFQLIFVD